MTDLSPEELNMINEISGNQLGAPAPQPAPQPQAQPQEQQTPQELATQEMAPVQPTVGDAPFEFFEVDTPHGKKQYTPEQLRGIASRYSDLNYRHQTQVALVYILCCSQKVP